jgi:hypothetical protein
MKFANAAARDAYIADRVAKELKKKQPEIVAKAAAAVRAKGATGRAIAKLVGNPAAEAQKAADANAAANARAMLLRGSSPTPTSDDLQAATGSALPFKKLGDVDQVRAILKAQRDAKR